jgi:phosphohistidine phosphatase
MKLYLVQHGEAKSKDVDPDRHLTEKGARDAERTAAFLKPLGLTVQAIWHSGKPRAAQTAEILARSLAPTDGVVERPGLAPNDAVEPAAEEANRAVDDLAIVGHLPFLARLAALIVAGAAEEGVVAFRNGGVVCLERDDGGAWSVLWDVIPDLLP